jgi:hypothetical protein
MNGSHLGVMDAASDGTTYDAAALRHLRWCLPCRRMVADYRWLQRGLGLALATLANTVDVPQPDWMRLRRRLRAARRRRQLARRMSGAFALSLAVCLAFLRARSGFGLPETGAGGTQALPVPSPALQTSLPDRSGSAATATATPIRDSPEQGLLAEVTRLPSPRGAPGAVPERRDGTWRHPLRPQ